MADSMRDIILEELRLKFDDAESTFKDYTYACSVGRRSEDASKERARIKLVSEIF